LRACAEPQVDKNRRLLLKVYLITVQENIPFKTIYAGPTTYADTIVEVVLRKTGITAPPDHFYLAEVYPTGGTPASCTAAVECAAGHSPSDGVLAWVRRRLTVEEQRFEPTDLPLHSFDQADLAAGDFRFHIKRKPPPVRRRPTVQPVRCQVD